MFQKSFRIKSNSNLKNSERKRFKAVLLKEFIGLEPEDIDQVLPQGKSFSLLKLISHGGHTVGLYMVDKTPLVFEINNKLYPSVFMLWRIPEIFPTLTIWPQLSEKIIAGADLMLPGVVVKGPFRPFCYGGFAKGARIVINTTQNKAPLAIGESAMSSVDMYMSANRGKALKVVHTYGDKLWEFGNKVEMPRLGPPVGYEDSIMFTSITETDMPVVPDKSECNVELKDTSGIETEISNIDTEKDFLTDVTTLSEKMEMVVLSSDSMLEETKELEVREIIPKENAVVSEDATSMLGSKEITQEMDNLLEYCFLKAIKMSVKKVDLPLLTSNFYKLHMIPACPLGRQVDIRKSSYKKLSKFLNIMEEKGVVKVKEVTKGVESIILIEHTHEMLRDFVDLERPSLSKTSPGATKPTVTEMYTVTATVQPILSTFGYRKGEMMTLANLRKCITEYVKKEKLQDPLEKSFVNINSALQQIVQDPNTMAMTWEDLMELFISHMSRGYKMSLPGEKSTAHKGKLEPIDIQIGRRTGNKKVTLINNLELYGIDITQFARECQHGVAASTSISTVPGRKSQQLLVQGNQVIFVGNLLSSKYQISKRYIRGLENAPRQKK